MLWTFPRTGGGSFAVWIDNTHSGHMISPAVLADIMAELQRVAADPAITFKDVTEGSVANDASPMRPDFVAAVKKSLDAVYPGVPVFPSMASGASDSMWFRYHHVPSYGASPTFIKASEDFSHGLNERTPIANIRPAIDYYLILFKDLSK